MTPPQAPVPVFRLLGDRGLLVEYPGGIDTETNQRVHALSVLIKSAGIPGVLEVIPAYCTLLLTYDPLLTTPDALQSAIHRMNRPMPETASSEPSVVRIPVYYGDEFGPDISFVAQYNRLEIEEVIRIHSQPDYRIFMMGFAPGFPFLGGLPKSLHTPRLATPRQKVPEGSVGIANGQTGIYPVSGPGGWRLIGRTPLRLFDPRRAVPFLYAPGDSIRFYPVSCSEFHRIAQGESS